MMRLRRIIWKNLGKTHGAQWEAERHLKTLPNFDCLYTIADGPGGLWVSHVHWKDDPVPTISGGKMMFFRKKD